MEGRKDISEMSFEEFFSEKDRIPTPTPAPVPRRQSRRDTDQAQVKRGFGGASPKINYKDGKFWLYVPRYSSDENARFEVAVDCPDGVVTLGRLESAPRGGGRLSRSETLDLTSAGVSPLKPFTLVIDGEEVFRHRPRGLLFFNNIGLPVGRPVGEVYIVRARGLPLRVVKTDVLETFDVMDATVSRAEVSVAGGVWIDDRRHDREQVEATVDKKAAEPVAEPAPAKPKVRRKKAKASLKVPAGIQDAEAMVDGVRLQIHRRFPAFTASLENCEPSECEVLLRGPDGAVIAGGNHPASGPMTFETDVSGPVEIALARDGQDLAVERFVLISDFECDRPGKGDIPTVTEFRFTAFGESRTADIRDGPCVFDVGGTSVSIIWNIPVVTYDIGSGPVQFQPFDVDVGDLGDTLVVTVTGARKKAMFIGGEKGKKREITPDWTDDTYRIALDPIREEIYASSSREFIVYITVNSFPMRRFMTISNPPRISASFADGSIVANVSQAGEYVCRLYKMDKSVETVPLQAGGNSVPVAADVVEAEVAEVHDGRDRTSVPVSVRPLPFLWKDETGEYWLYVNRSKRIPLPGEMVSGGKPEASRIRVWHDQITRMNPELRDVTTAMMQRAFDDMAW